MARLALGIDTSCYTTSMAVMDEEFNLVRAVRRLLAVKPGEKGLRQSEALFQHIKNMPLLMDELTREVDFRRLDVVAVSARPRPVDGSYMPVFMGCESFGHVIAGTLNIPLTTYSHQEGHIMAGIWSSKAYHLLKTPFLAFHISGGTTEMLHVAPKDAGFSIELVGGSRDLHAGQMIDRIGVMLGMPFPCGPHLEVLALQTGEEERIPDSVSGTWMNLSGAETHAKRLLEAGKPGKAVARGVLQSLSRALEKVIRSATTAYGICDILMVGGVSANSIIKKYLKERLGGTCAVYFATPEFSSDNAAGTALLGLRSLTGVNYE